MAAKRDTSPVRGMRDIAPADGAVRWRVVRTIVETYARHGFRPIETPALEHLELLSGGDGGENEKLIYRVMKRGDKLATALSGGGEIADAGLRYDLTVPLARFVAAHRSELLFPARIAQIGSVWRAERPQKNRYRQFTQCDIDIVGDATVGAEAALIAATYDCVQALGVPARALRISDRRILSLFLDDAAVPASDHARAMIALDKLDKIGVDGVVADLADFGDQARRLVDALVAARAGGVASLAKAFSHSRPYEQVAADLERTLSAIDAVAGAGWATFDPTLVRGMGYYTGQIFEVTADGMDASIAGGGRYDGLIGRISGTDLPACGISLGFERLCELVDPQRLGTASPAERLVVFYDDLSELPTALALAQNMRAGYHAVLIAQRDRKKHGRQLSAFRDEGYGRGRYLNEDVPFEITR